MSAQCAPCMLCSVGGSGGVIDVIESIYREPSQPARHTTALSDERWLPLPTRLIPHPEDTQCRAPTNSAQTLIRFSTSRAPPPPLSLSLSPRNFSIVSHNCTSNAVFSRSSQFSADRSFHHARQTCNPYRSHQQRLFCCAPCDFEHSIFSALYYR